jgi:hypothetical protein
MALITGTNADFQRGFNLLKRVYAGRVEDLVPDSDRLSKDIPFAKPDQQIGQDYFQPVTLSREMGATFWNTGAVQTLNQPLASADEVASIRGSEIAVRAALSYKFIHSALKKMDGTRGGVKAFVNATVDRFARLTKGGSYFREATLLYGGGTGAVSYLGLVANTTGSATTNLVVQMTAGEFATALWAGSEGGEFDIYAPNGTKRNTAGTAGTADAVFKLSGSNAATYQVFFTSNATNVSAVVAGDQIFFLGARGQDALGFVGAALTQAGSLWGISTSTYGLWKPTVIPVGGALTFAAVSEGAARVASTGFYGDYDLYVSPKGFADICDDQTALVTHTTKSSGSVTIGFDSVTFLTQAGKTHLKVHPYMKNGYALGIPRGECMRIGSTDLTHTIDGYGRMFRELENASGVEMRLYTDQAPFCKNPQYIQLYTGIVNTTD